MDEPTDRVADEQIEEAIRGSIKRTSAGTHLALEPDIAQEIVQAVKNECGHLPPTAQRPVILTAMDIRRYVRKLLEYEFNPPFSVVSYQELSPDLNIQPVASGSEFTKPGSLVSRLLTSTTVPVTGA